MRWGELRRVVAPVDPADPDECGLRMALDTVLPENVHVVVALTERLVADATDRVAEARTQLRSWLAGQGFPDGIRTHVGLGRPADVIVDVAVTVDADLVALASHGRRGVPRLVLGSVTEEVVRRAPCAVLVLRRAAINE